ncbi:hypothetical protein RF11_01936 [Thelohanellus kitauei]|uniref:Uncharacterized protein n=1 Tax=Thelohanellus kitauei TaxID=669202 RepID=A0A0C2IFX0_THEKT|nr:hypothetical protein RF11_01936 [Thelohanellus kitauei]
MLVMIIRVICFLLLLQWSVSEPTLTQPNACYKVIQDEMNVHKTEPVYVSLQYVKFPSFYSPYLLMNVSMDFTDRTDTSHQWKEQNNYQLLYTGKSCNRPFQVFKITLSVGQTSGYLAKYRFVSHGYQDDKLEMITDENNFLFIFVYFSAEPKENHKKVILLSYFQLIEEWQTFSLMVEAEISVFKTYSDFKTKTHSFRGIFTGWRVNCDREDIPYSLLTANFIYPNDHEKGASLRMSLPYVDTVAFAVDVKSVRNIPVQVCTPLAESKKKCSEITT